MFTLCTTEYKGSSANNLALDNNSSAWSFIYIKHSRGRSICPFNATLCFLFLPKSSNKFKSSPDIPFCFNLKIIASYHMVPNGFDTSRKTF